MSNKEEDKYTRTPRPSAGGVVLNSEGRIVLVCQHANSWSLPKGGLEPGESELDAARREVFEETGLQDIQLLQDEPLGSYERYSLAKDGVSEAKEWGKRRRTFFLFLAKDALPHFGGNLHAQSGGEVTDAKWFSLDEALEALTHPKDREFLASVRGKIERVHKDA